MADLSIWKIFGLFGFVSTWAQEALMPDDDGTVRLTVEELAALATGMCGVFGWSAEITMPDSDKAA